MPPNRTDTASARRARREQNLAVRTVSSNANAAGSISAPGKLEPPKSPTITIPARPNSKTHASQSHSSSKTQPKPWRHADELPFIRSSKTWPDLAVARFLRATAISIPPVPISNSERFILVRCADGSDVALPRGYRLPLLWVVKFLWSSVPLVLAEPGGWDEGKFDLLHVARLIDTLLSGARRIKEEKEKQGRGMDRSYRCAAFDRALRRYWHRWLVMRDEFVRDFWREFEEEEFKEDVLKLGWATWVLKGHKGFYLTKDEVANGLTSDEFMRNFVVDEEKKTFAWVGAPAESQSASPAAVEAPAPAPLPQSELFLSPLKTSKASGNHAPVQSMQDMSTSASNSAGAAPPLASAPPLKRARKDKSASASIFAGVYPPVARRRKVPQLGSLPLPTRDLDNTSSPLFSPPPLRRTSSAVTSTANLQAQLPQPQPQPQPKFPNKSKSPPGPVGNLKSKSTANKDAEVPVRGSVSLAELVSRIPLGGGRHRLHNLHSNIFEERPSLSVPPPPPSDNATAGGGAQMQPVVEPSVSERILLRGEREREREGENTPILAEGSRPDVEMQDVSVDQNTANVAKPVGCSEVKAIKEEIAALSENVQPDLDSDDDLVLLYPQSSPVQPRSPTSRVSPPHPLLRSRSESPSDSDSDSSRSSSPPMLSLSTARFPSENPHARPPSPAVSKPHYMPGWDSSSPSQSTPPLPPPTSASSFASTSTTTSTATAVTSTAVSELSAPQSLVELAADPAFLTRLVDSWQELRTEVSALREELRSRAESESGDAAMTARLEERVRKLEGERGSASISQARPPAIPSRISESVSVALQFQSNAAAAGAPMHWHPLQHLIAGDGIEDGGDGNTQMLDVQRSAEGPRATATTQRGISGLGGPGFSGSEVLLPPRSRKFREGVRLGSV